MKAKDNKVIQKVRKFEQFLDSFSDYGSCDSEPQLVFRILRRQVFEGRNDINVPKTARGWQLYCGMEGAEDVARSIGNAFENLRLDIYESDYREAIFAANYYGVFDEIN